MKRAAVVGLAALATLSCAPASPRTSPAAAVVQLATGPVPLDPESPDRLAVGAFTYAGGIEIVATTPPVLLELSDLRIDAENRLLAVGDGGSFFESRLLLDGRGRPAGLAEARVTPLTDAGGDPLSGAEADAEGLAVLPGGDRLVSFEGLPRIFLYPADGGPPRPVPVPDAPFPDNAGLEALTHYPAAAPDAYLAGSENGTIWLCRLSAHCELTALGVHTPPGFGLTALAAYGEDGAFALLARAYDAERGPRMVLRLVVPTGTGSSAVRDELALERPLTVDNFEGVAIVPRPGGLRLYVLSDDNGSASQRTLLLAFDWQPPADPGRQPR